MNLPPEDVPIELGERSYQIRIGAGLLSDRTALEGLPHGHTAVIVTNPTVAPLYGHRLRALLNDAATRCLVVELPDGEIHKDWSSLERIFGALLRANADRKTVLYALGGGVVGDITGFAAACYMGGI